MKNYKVYLEIYGKKLCKKVLAENEFEAEKQIYKDLIIHKTEIDTKDIFNQSMNILDDIHNNVKN